MTRLPVIGPVRPAGRRRSWPRAVSCLLWIVLWGAWFPWPGHAETYDDNYIMGYASAVLEQQFHLKKGTISVRNGTLTIVADDIVGVERDQMMAALKKIRGVEHLELLSATAANGQTEGQLSTTLSVPEETSDWFPRGHLFKPFHADPRWPHFAATVRSYLTTGEADVNTAFAGDFGETLALYRRNTGLGQWEVNLQAGAFSFFDIGRSDRRLINTDYMVGGLISYRLHNWSAFLRYYHQSSHLGDELLMRSGQTISRMNISYEMLDLKLSYDLWGILRFYGGAGVLTRRDPSILAPYRLQYGAEYQHPTTIVDGVRPVVYADFQTYREQRPRPSAETFNTNVSLRAGLQFESLSILDRKLQLLLEYYSGDSPNGQFFTRRIETIGIGLHVYF
jgi:Protein of unknown function (DUF1207)